MNSFAYAQLFRVLLFCIVFKDHVREWAFRVPLSPTACALYLRVNGLSTPFFREILAWKSRLPNVFSLLQRNSSYIQAISVKHTCFTEIIMFQFPNKIHFKRIYCGLGCTSQCVVSGAMGRSDSSYTIASIAASIPLMMSSRERLGVLGRCCTCSCIKGTCMNPPRICGKDLLIW